MHIKLQNKSSVFDFQERRRKNLVSAVNFEKQPLPLISSSSSSSSSSSNCTPYYSLDCARCGLSTTTTANKSKFIGLVLWSRVWLAVVLC